MPRTASVISSHRDDADIVVPQHPLSHRLRAWGLWLILMGLLAWSWAPSEMFRVSALFTDWRNMAEFGHAFLHPNFHDWDTYLADMIVTIQIAIWGTTWLLALCLYGPVLVTQFVMLPISNRAIWDLLALSGVYISSQNNRIVRFGGGQQAPGKRE